MARTKFKPIQQDNTGITTYTNPHADGGTFYYLDLGGLKLLWGLTGAKTVAGTTNVQFFLTLPVGFFTNVRFASLTAANMTSVAEQFANIATMNTTTISGYIRNLTASSGTSQASILVIGN